MKSASKMLILLLTTTVAVGLEAAPKEKKASKKLVSKLKRGSSLSLRMKKPRRLSEVLARIEKTTGNRIQITDEFGSPSNSALAGSVTLNFRKRSFWDAVIEIEKVTGSRFGKLKNNALVLTSGKSHDVARMNRKPAGKPVVHGAFLLLPEIDTFFGRLLISVRPEPWIGTPSLLSSRVVLTGDAGQKKEIEADKIFSKMNVHTGELDLHFNLKDHFGKKENPEFGLARKVELEAELRVALERGKKILKPLGSLVARPQKRGASTFRVTEARKGRTYSGGKESFVVRLKVLGEPLDTAGILLKDGEGNLVKPIHRSDTKDEEAKMQDVRLEFPPAGLAGKVKDYRLLLSGEDARGVKPLTLSGSRVARVVRAGAVTIRVVEARSRKAFGDEKEFVVGLEISGGQVSPESLGLLDKEKNLVKPTGWSSSTARVQHLSRFYATSAFKGDPLDCRIVIEVPTSSTTYTLKTSFKDVRLDIKK